RAVAERGLELNTGKRLLWRPDGICGLDRNRAPVGPLHGDAERSSPSVIARNAGLRKLEYIVPDAIASNADTLVSIGGVQSNHTRMVAAVAAKIGMKCRLVQESWVPHEDAVYDRVGNILLSRIMGGAVEMVDEGFEIGIRQSWEEAIE